MSLKQIVSIYSDGTNPTPGPADYIEWSLPWTAGDWGVLAIFKARTDGGKGHVTLELDQPDGTTTSLDFGSFDTYAASAAWDTVQTTGWLGGAGSLVEQTVPDIMQGRLRVTADDKHASSSGYVVEIQALMFWRTDTNPFAYPADFNAHSHLITPLFMATDASGWQNATEATLAESGDLSGYWDLDAANATTVAGQTITGDGDGSTVPLVITGATVGDTKTIFRVDGTGAVELFKVRADGEIYQQYGGLHTNNVRTYSGGPLPIPDGVRLTVLGSDPAAPAAGTVYIYAIDVSGTLHFRMQRPDGSTLDLGSPLTTKGDLFTFSTVDARLGVGANKAMLVADSAQTTGLKWLAENTTAAANATPLAAGTAGTSGQAPALQDHTHRAPGGIARLTSVAAIANTETVVVSASMPANFCAAGTTFLITAYGRLTSGGTGGTATFAIRMGTTTLTGNIATSVSPVNANSVTDAPFRFEALVTVRSAGAGGTVIGNCMIAAQSAAPVAFTSKDTISAISATVALDTTATKLIELTYISGNAGTTASFENAAIDVVHMG